LGDIAEAADLIRYALADQITANNGFIKKEMGHIRWRGYKATNTSAQNLTVFG
jgi:hypothetical protein